MRSDWGREDIIILDPTVMVLNEGLDKMLIVVTPLNLLGKQNIRMLEMAALSGIAVSGKNTSASIFKVSLQDFDYQIEANWT